MSIVNNLREFLTERGFDSWREWARCFYRYNDIGPWVVFRLKTDGPKDIEVSTVINLAGDHPVFEEEMHKELEMFIGIDDPEWLSTTPKFVEDVKDFFRSNEWPKGQPLIDGPSGMAMVQAGMFASYEYTTPTTLVITMRWKEHPPKREVYYEDKADFDVDDCIGIEVGSIVEGSEVNGTPFYCAFPFSTDDFDKQFDGLTGEVDFYWKRDNSYLYLLKKDGQHAGWVKECNGEWEWDSILDEELQGIIEEMDDLPCGPEEPTAVPGREGVTIEFIYDESTY